MNDRKHFDAALAATCGLVLCVGCFWISLWIGLIPCRHRCYWCGKALATFRETKPAGYVWSLNGIPQMFGSYPINDEWRPVYFENEVANDRP